MKTILSLFDESGNWPAPYARAGYRVIQIDLQHDGDVLDLAAGKPTTARITAPEHTMGAGWEPQTQEPRAVDICAKDGGHCLHWHHGHHIFEPVHGILAAPPCTDFSGSGAQYWPAKDADGRTAAALQLIDATLKLVDLLGPAWWAMENPAGRLPTLRPLELGRPQVLQPPPEIGARGPRRYFDPCWYGDAYTKKTGLWGHFNANLPTSYVEPERVCGQGSWLMKLGGKSERTKRLRSTTPPGFARAFFTANP